MATPQWYQWWKFRKPADYIPPAIGEARIGQPSRLEEATPWARSIADILGTAGRAVGDYLGGFEERRQRTIEAAPEALRPFLKEPLPERLLEALRTTPENVAGILSALAQTGQMRAREGPDWAEAVEQGRQWWRGLPEPQVLPDIYPVVPPGEVPEAYPVPGTEPILEKPVLPWKGFLETLPETPLYGGPVMGPARAAAAREATQATRAGARRLLAEEAGMVRVPRGKPFFEGMKPIDVWDGLGRAEKMRAVKAAELDPKIATKLWKDIGTEERAALEGLVPERVAPPEVRAPEAMPMGRETVAYGPDPNKSYRMRYRLVDLDELIPSHTDAFAINPAYPSELQPRQRARGPARLQVEKIARDLVPESLISDTGMLDRGSPIIGFDRVVESGNGRVLALRKARESYPSQWQAYQQSLRDALPQFGIEEGQLAQMSNPVLVRERVSDVDRVRFAAEANQPAVAVFSPTENAAQDARSISFTRLFVPEETQSLDATLRMASNKPFIVSFLETLPANERGSLVDAAGDLNLLGMQRIKAAMFARTYSGEAGQRLTRTFFESREPIIRNVEDGMLASLPKMAQAEDLVRSGQRATELTISEDLAKSLDMLARIKQRKLTVDQYLAQVQMFEQELTPLQGQLLKHFEGIARSPRQVREFLGDYADAVIASPHPQQSVMLGGPRPTKEGLLNATIRRQTEGPLFAQAAPQVPPVGAPEAPRRGLVEEGAISQAEVARGRKTIAERTAEEDARRLAQLQALEEGQQRVASQRDWARSLQVGDEVRALGEDTRIRRIIEEPDGSRVFIVEGIGSPVGELQISRVVPEPGRLVPPEAPRAGLVEEAPGLPEAEVTAAPPFQTSWQRALREAERKVDEIEAEWVAKEYVGITGEQQARVDMAISEVATQFNVPESILRRQVLWEAKPGPRKGQRPMTEAEALAELEIFRRIPEAPAIARKVWQMTREERIAEVAKLKTENREILATPLMSEGEIAPSQVASMGKQQRALWEKNSMRRMDIEAQIRILESDERIASLRAKMEAITTAEKAQVAWMHTRDEWVAERLANKPQSLAHLTDKEFAKFEARRHAKDVKEAVAQGKPVPPEVLADYPDLAQIAPRVPEEVVAPPEAPRLVPKLTEPPPAEALLPEQEAIPRPEVSDEVLREELGRRWRQQNEEFWAREQARQGVPGEAPPPPPTEPPIAPPPGEGVPPGLRPPEPPRQPPGGEVPPTGGPGEPLFERGRQPTIAATERATTIEEKLAKQRATDESIFSPSQTLEEVANPQILQLQQTAPDVFQRLQETFQRLPVLRWIGQEIEPIGAAVARAKAGLPIALAVVKRALYVRTEQARALLETQIWRAGNKEILGLRNGVATKVRLNESAQALADAGMMPKQSIGRLSDIIEHIEEYVLSPEQRRAIVQLQNTWNANIEALLKAGIDVNEVDRYFPRLVTKAPSGVEGVHTTSGALKARTFKSERAGIRAGYQYADPLEAMITRLTDNVSLIANKRLMEQIRSLGEKPSERLKRTGAEALVSRKAAREAFAAARDEVKAAENDIIKNQRAARRVKDPTRKAAYTEYAEDARLRLEEAQTALEQAQTDLKQSAQVLRQAARKAAEPSLVKGEIKAAGRIFPKEVGQELKSYGLEKFLPEDPSLIDDFFATYRGSMVTGDWSQLLVQGNNLLWRDPLSWFKATAGSLEATLRNPDSWLLANADAIRSAIKAGAATAPEEFLLREGGKLSRALARLPLVKQTQRSFEWFTLLNQVERWKALKGMEKMGGELAQTASIVRKQSGVILRPGLTKGQLRAERYTFFAPRFLGSLVSLVTDAARPGVAGNEARKILASIFVGATAATTAGQLAATGELPNFTDPDADGWFSIRFKTGETVNLYGPLYPYFRAMAQFGKRMVEGNYDKAAEALTFLARGRVSATIGPFIDFMTGRGFSGRIERSPLGFFLAYLERVGPIGPRQIANHIRKVWEERAQPFPWIAGEMAGLRTTDQSTIDRFDYIARQATGDKITHWQDLPAAQRLELESSPEVLALLDPGEKTIPMNLRRYLEPRDYENWRTVVDATSEEFLALPEIERLGAKAPLTGGTIDKKRLSLEQRAEYQRLFWEKAKPGLERLFGSPTYKAAKDDYRRRLISRILGTARDSVHAKVLKIGAK